MPELPEVEVVRRTLAPRVAGRLIERVEILSPLCADNRPAELRTALEGGASSNWDGAGSTCCSSWTEACWTFICG